MDGNNTELAVNGFPTLTEVCESPNDFLGKLDVGALNLICATGLPEAENLDVGQCVAWLDNAARQVDFQIRSRFDMFAATPSVYENSFGKFCCNYLLRTLQELYGVQYNPARIADSSSQYPLGMNPDFRDSRDLFLHGMMNGPGGTCASMPVMYVAIGRRLGYPLKLVQAPGHLFFRWEDPEGRFFGMSETFNVEGTGPGMSFYPDEFYRTWPRAWKPFEKTSGWYLKSLSPVEELAAFLSNRGSCLEDNGRIKDGIQAFRWATKLAPDDLRYGSELVKLLRRGLEEEWWVLESERRSLEVERMMLQQSRQRLRNDPCGASGPPHGISCQCLHYRQARQPVHALPGHPPNCGCAHCKLTYSFNPW